MLFDQGDDIPHSWRGEELELWNNWTSQLAGFDFYHTMKPEGDKSFRQILASYIGAWMWTNDVDTDDWQSAWLEVEDKIRSDDFLKDLVMYVDCLEPIDLDSSTIHVVYEFRITDLTIRNARVFL